MSDALPFLSSSSVIVDKTGKMTPQFSKYSGNIRLFLDEYLKNVGIRPPAFTTAKLNVIAQQGASLGRAIAFDLDIDEYVALKKIPGTTNYRFEKIVTQVI